jgi:hypothetical protein
MHFFGEPQRVVGGQHVHQRAEAKTLGALRHRGKEDARRRREAERRRMMLAHVVGPKSRGIVEFDQSQAVFVLLAELIRSAVVLIEYTKLHHTTCRHAFSGSAVMRW